MRLALLLGAVSLAGPAAAAGFDCTGAPTAAEHAICASRTLSALRDLVDRSYRPSRRRTGCPPPT